MNWKKEAFASIPLALGVAVAVWLFRPVSTEPSLERARANVESVLQARGGGMDRLEVQEATVKSAVFVKYRSPSIVAHFKRWLSRQTRYEDDPVWGVWTNTTRVAYCVDLGKMRFFLHAVGGAGTIRLTVVSPVPKCDDETCKVNLDTLGLARHSGHAISAHKDQFSRIEAVARQKIRSDIQAQAHDSSLVDDARDAARKELCGFYAGLFPELEVDVRFSDETLPPDAMEVAQ